ncbi:MAG: tyrosine--tRNA ligase, partial [Bacteroidales bacterium]|nr:tyrosine--tRNA ligase [Bacteroidales bacterium]
SDGLRKLDEKTFLAVFAGVPTFDVSKQKLPCDVVTFLSGSTANGYTEVFPSKTEAKKMIIGNGVSINKDKVTDIEYQISENDIVDGKYILAQKGKKNYFIINII